MRGIPVSMVLALALVSCTDTGLLNGEYGTKRDIDRKVVVAKTPEGRTFHFMPIDEDGVDEIMITSAWPTPWAYRAHNNPAVPEIAAEVIMTGGTNDLAPEDVLNFFNDRNALGRLYIRSDHVIGELSVPRAHLDDIVSMTSEMLSMPLMDPASVERIKSDRSATRIDERAQKGMRDRIEDMARLAILGDGPLNDFLSLADADAIERIGIDDLRRWHRQTIVGSGLTIAVAGAITRQDAGKAIDRLLSGLPDGKNEAAAPAVQTDFSPRTILLHTPEASRSMLGFFGRISPFAEGGGPTDLLALHSFTRRGGALFDTLMKEPISANGFEAGFVDYDRTIRLMSISVDVDESKLAKAALSVLRRYEDYRADPDPIDIDESQRELTELFHGYSGDVDGAARTILKSALKESESGDAHRSDRTPGNIEAEDVSDRLSWAFPSSRDLIIVAITPDADALPGACVVTEIEQVASCSLPGY